MKDAPAQGLSAKDAPESKASTYSWRVASALFVIVVVTYLPALWNDFVWDDLAVIVQGEHLSQWSSILDAFAHPAMWFRDSDVGPVGTYRPLGIASLVVDYQLWQLDATGYHMTSIALHALAMVLLFLLFRRWLRDRTAFLATLIVAIHPTCAEAVVWINGRSEIFVLLFGIAALLLATAEAVSKWRWLSIGVCLFLALLGKETGLFFLPLVVIASGISNTGGKRGGRALRRRMLVAAILCCIVLVGYLALRITALGSSAAPPLGETAAAMWTLPVVWIHSLQVVLIPIDLGIIPLGTYLRSLGTAAVLAHAAGAALVLGGGIYLAHRRWWLPLFGLLWWFIVLSHAPLLMVKQWPGFHRWLYVGLPGLVLACTWLLRRSVSKRMGLVLAVLALLVSIVQLQRAIRVWHNQATLFYQMTVEWPDDPDGHSTLGSALLDWGQPAPAEQAIRRAIELESTLPEVHWLHAAAIAEQGRCDEALRAACAQTSCMRQSAPRSQRRVAQCFVRTARSAEARPLLELCATTDQVCAELLRELERE